MNALTKGELVVSPADLVKGSVYYIDRLPARPDLDDFGFPQYSGVGTFIGMGGGTAFFARFSNLKPDNPSPLNGNETLNIWLNTQRIFTAIPVSSLWTEYEKWGIYVEVDSRYGNDRGIYERLLVAYDTKEAAEADLEEMQANHIERVFVKKLPGSSPAPAPVVPVKPVAPVANEEWGVYLEYDDSKDRGFGRSLLYRFPTKAEAEANLVEYQMTYVGRVYVEQISGVIPNVKAEDENDDEDAEDDEESEDMWGVYIDYREDSGYDPYDRGVYRPGVSASTLHGSYGTKSQADNALVKLQNRGVTDDKYAYVEKIPGTKRKLSPTEIKTRKIKEEERLLKLQEENRKKEVARQEAERIRLEAEELQRIQDARMIQEIQEVYECLE